jgi:hypothetical protein
MRWQDESQNQKDQFFTRYYMKYRELSRPMKECIRQHLVS